MKFTNILFLLFFILQKDLQAQNIAHLDSLNTEGGILFIHENFKEALAKATKENKLIFIDAYTTWCKPCKTMSKQTFTDTAVGQLFNQKFVNLKMDMEKGDGPELLQRYNIVAYPTLLFLNSDGEMVHKALGFQNVEQFLTLGKTALAGEQTLGSWAARYDAGERNGAFLKEYASVLAEAYDPNRFKIADEYLETQADWKTPTNLAFIYQFTEGVDSRLFMYLVKNQKDFEKKFTKDEISLKIQNTASEFLLNEKKLPSLSAADSIIRLVYPLEKQEKTIKNYRLTYYRMKGDRPNYVKSAIDYLKKYDNAPEELNDIAATFFEQIEDKNDLEKAIKWAKRSVKLEKRFMNQIVVAQLYQKIGKTSKARKEAQKAIDIAKITGENYDEATELLSYGL